MAEHTASSSLSYAMYLVSGFEIFLEKKCKGGPLLKTNPNTILLFCTISIHRNYPPRRYLESFSMDFFMLLFVLYIRGL